MGSPRGLGARSPRMQAGERCRRCGARLSRTRYCDGSEQLMCQWSLLGGRVFSGLMNRRAVMGSSQPPGPGGLFGGKKGDARAARAVCTVWGVCVGCLGRDSLGRCGSGGSLLPCPCSLSREGKFGASCWACRGSWGGCRDPSGAHTSPGWGSRRARRGCCLCTHGCHGSPASAKAEIRERDPWEARRGPGGLTVLLLRSRLR